MDNERTLFVFEHPGVWLPGITIVVADSREEAEELALLKIWGEYKLLKIPREVNMEELTLKKTRVVPPTPFAVLIWDGDY